VRHYLPVTHVPGTHVCTGALSLFAVLPWRRRNCLTQKLLEFFAGGSPEAAVVAVETEDSSVEVPQSETTLEQV